MKKNITKHLVNLSHEDLIKITGGGYSESFEDPEGYTWTYYYDDCGELTSMIVDQRSCRIL